MFKNKAFQVKVVNTDNEPIAPAAPEEDFLDKTVYAAEAAKRLIWTGAGAVIAYVAADTVRRVTVELAKK